MGLSNMTDDLHAKREAASRAHEARIEYGRTVADARRLLKRAKSVRLWVRRGLGDDGLIIDITPSAFRTSTKYDQAGDAMPCSFDPDDHRLRIGCIRALHKAREGV
jgi:hypothetical protein